MGNYSKNKRLIVKKMVQLLYILVAKMILFHSILSSKYNEGENIMKKIIVCLLIIILLLFFAQNHIHHCPTESNAPTENNNPKTTEPSKDSTLPWNLILVNKWNPLTEDFSVTLTNLKNGHAIDERAYPDLQNMMDAARAEGLSPPNLLFL